MPDETARRQRWHITSEHNTRFVMCLFSATRSVLKQAAHIPPAPDIAPSPVDYNYKGLAVTLSLSSEMTDTSRTTLIETESYGEPLRLLAAITFEKKLEPVAVETLIADAAKQVDCKRGKIAMLDKLLGDPSHLFFHELDRHTHQDFIRYAESETVASERIKTVHQLARQLRQRLLSRIGLCERCVPSAEHLAEISNIFKESAERAWGHPEPMKVAAAMLDFAAGWLGRTVRVHVNSRLYPEIINEPDSTFVFYFAEFAIAAMEQSVDSDFWRDTIPSLVLMQRYYFERMHRCGCRLRFDDYGPPMTLLTQQHRDQLNQYMPSSDDESIHRAIVANLQLADLTDLRCG